MIPVWQQLLSIFRNLSITGRRIPPPPQSDLADQNLVGQNPENTVQIDSFRIEARRHATVRYRRAPASSPRLISLDLGLNPRRQFHSTYIMTIPYKKAPSIRKPSLFPHIFNKGGLSYWKINFVSFLRYFLYRRDAAATFQ